MPFETQLRAKARAGTLNPDATAAPRSGLRQALVESTYDDAADLLSPVEAKGPADGAPELARSGGAPLAPAVQAR